MVDEKGLEAAARKLRNAEKEKFGSWPDADDSRNIAAAIITAYLSSVQAEPVAQIDDKMIEAVKFEIAQLRHAYTHLLSHDMKGIANGLISPAIGTLERLTAALAEREPVADGPVEQDIDRLRLQAFKTNSNDDKAAYYRAVSKWFLDRHYRSALVATPPASTTTAACDLWDAATNAVCQTMQDRDMCKCPDGKCLAATVEPSPQDLARYPTPPAERVVEAAELGASIDALAYRFWSIHPKELDPFAVSMPVGYKGGVRAWYFATEMRNLLAALAAKPAVNDDETVVEALRECLTYIRSPLRMTRDEDEEARRAKVIDRVVAALAATEGRHE